MGFEEVSPKNVREKIKVEGNKIISKVNGKVYQFGELEIPALYELRQKSLMDIYRGNVIVKEVVGDVQDLHVDPDNENALFQVASQFNLLEMLSPERTPELGVGIYERDYTQGPACAIACGAGTIYRNYFVPLNQQIGQSFSNQIDCLDLIGEELKNDKYNLWRMINGYALMGSKSLQIVNDHINQLDDTEREALKSKLKIGIQWKSEVTIGNSSQLVSQVFCSALPVAYSHLDPALWESFARLILEATYEATLHTALINLDRNYSNKVFLTLVGGGAFGNDIDWIMDAIFKAISKFKKTALEISIVSHSSSNIHVDELVEMF
ncbi:hypothetical protein [Flammeovirga aprica]|nr:hypothetical protein [Flammeovirga aprica]